MDSKQVIEALEELISTAERVDGWESFPSEPIEKARSALASLQPAQEPVWHQRRLKREIAPGAINQWTQCDSTEATDMFERKPGYEYRAIYAFPLPQSALSTDAQKVRNEALECLQDVVSHHSDFSKALATHHNACQYEGDRAYWKHEMAVLDRMKRQAEDAIRALQSQSLPSSTEKDPDHV